jgi:hypothetical protein
MDDVNKTKNVVNEMVGAHADMFKRIPVEHERIAWSAECMDGSFTYAQLCGLLAVALDRLAMQR